MTTNQHSTNGSGGVDEAQRQRNRRKKKILVGVAILATFPISIPLLILKTVKRKRRKAKMARAVHLSDSANTTTVNPYSQGGANGTEGRNEEPLLSLIMPIYNIDAYLEASILSVLNQSYSHFELIIVNDASTDKSLSIARMFERIDSRVRVIDLPYNTPGGAGVPSNIGVEHAKGEFIGFVDGDDFVNRTSLATLMSFAKSQKSDLTIGLFKNFTNDTKEISDPADLKLFAEIPHHEKVVPEQYPALLKASPVPWRKIYKSTFMESCSVRFPEGDLFFEDNPLHWSAVTAAESMTIVPTFVSYHRHNRAGQTLSSAPINLAAFFQHFTNISNSIRANKADYAWEPLLEFVASHTWVINKQSDIAHTEHLKMRFQQVIEEQIVPFLDGQRLSVVQKAKLKLDFGTKKKPADLSIVIYHNAKTNSIGDLDKTLASIHRLQGINVETILLQNGSTGHTEEGAREVLQVPVNKGLSKSYNQAIQLCSGDYVAFLESGDSLDSSVVTSVESARSNLADCLNCEESDVELVSEPGANLYSRRLIQDNAIFFGPTDFGSFAFDLLCRLYSRRAQQVIPKPIERKKRQNSSIKIADLAQEAGALARTSIFRGFEVDEIEMVLKTVSDLFDALEHSLDSGTSSELQDARNYASEQFEMSERLSAEHIRTCLKAD